MGFIFYLSINKFIDNYLYQKSAYKYNLEDYLQEINRMIDIEFSFVVVLSHIGKDINMITDFKAILKEISTNVINSLTPEYLNSFEVSTKLSRKYINTHIVRQTELKLMEYMKEHTGIEKKEE